MKKLYKLSLILCLLLMACNSPSDKEPNGDNNQNMSDTKWVMGYYVGYHSHFYPPEYIEFKYLTHIALGAVLPNTDGTLNTNFFLGPTAGPPLARRISNLAHNADVKAILMIGGAGAHDNWVAAASDLNRPTFVTNLLQAMDDLGYDGLDLDWEPIRESDEPLLKALILELRSARPNIILTLPVGWKNANFPTVRPFYREIAPYLDQMNIMSYVMVWEGDGWQSWHSSALKGHTRTTPSSVETSVQAYLDVGIPSTKIGVGIGFFGVCWKGGITGPNQTFTNSPHYAASDNDISYTKIMSGYYSDPIYRWDNLARVPYLSDPNGVGQFNCTFLSYENEDSIAEKGAYIHSNNLGGAIIWTITQGYISSNPEGLRNPLLKAIADALQD